MKSKAIFSGTFDPFTIGHYAIVERALAFFDEIIIGVGVNNAKKDFFFPLEMRLAIIEKSFEKEPRVRAISYDCLTADLAKQVEAAALIRGVRSVADFEYEKTIADVNRACFGLETLLLFSEPSYSHVNATIIRELLRYNKSVDKLMPPNVDIQSFIEKK